MREADADVARLLLPDATDGRRRAVLLADLAWLRARREGVSAPVPDVDAARADLERIAGEELAAALDALLAGYLGAALPREAFARWRRGNDTLAAAWSTIERLRQDGRNVPHVPWPGESALDVARRLLAALGGTAPADPAWRLWHARLAHAERGAAEAERVLTGLLPVGQPTSARVAAAFVAERAELALSRGAVARARGELERAGALAASDAALARIWWQALVAAGEWDRAAEVLGTGSDAVPLPSPLARLRAACPALSDRLPGRASTFPVPPVREERGSRERAGASFFAVVAVGAAGDVRVLAADAAPALRPRVARWSEERDGALTHAGAPERELALDPRARRWHKEGDAARLPLWRAVLGGARVLALALEPILDEAGELSGWLWIECEHHLLPAPETIAAWSRAARDEVLAASRASAQRAALPPTPPVAVAVAETVEGAGAFAALPMLPPQDPRAAFARALGASLPMKLAQRRWWCFADERGAARPLAEGGGAFEGAVAGGFAAFARVRRTMAPLVHSDPDPALSPVRDAASGVVMPLALGGRFVGWFAVVSQRRRDFSEREVEELERHLAHAPEGLLFAGLAALDAGAGRGARVSPAGRPSARDVVAAAEGTGALTIVGPRGSGTTTVARWVLASAGIDARAVREWCAHDFDGTSAPHGTDGAAGILVEGLERWSPRAQLALEAALDAAPSAVRIAATATAAPAELAARGALRPALAERLARRELFVPSLAECRAALAGRIEERIAAEARAVGERAPILDDGALALLWRQPWEGNLRELGAVAQSLVARHAGEHVDEASAAAALAARGLTPLARVPSRGASRAWLLAAVEATRTGTGRINKTRAARFLGWDPDTLVARLAASNLADHGA